MLHPDTWLSEQLGVTTHRYEPPFAGSNVDGFVCAKIESVDLESAKLLLAQGFELAETQYVFQQNEISNSAESALVRPVNENERLAVLNIAEKAFENSRFYRDKRLGSKVGNSLKRAWTENYFIGRRGTELLVFPVEKKIAGFVLLLSNTIDLIAVDSSFRGRGIGAALIATAGDLAGPLTAGTQSQNTPSIRLYQKCGFALTKINLVFHRHTSL